MPAEDACVVFITETRKRLHADAVALDVRDGQAFFIQGHGRVEAILPENVQGRPLTQSQHRDAAFRRLLLLAGNQGIFHEM